MKSAIIFALLVAVCTAQRWNVESFRGPNSEGYQYQVNYSQCFGLARRSRQVRVDIPSLYNTKTRMSSPIPPALYNADQNLITKLESEGWVVRTQKSIVPQIVYERVPVCCPWEQSCDQRQSNQVSQESNAPCVNGGQLIYKDGQQVCQCPDGFRGLWCQTPEMVNKPEPKQNFPTGPVIRLASTSGPLMNQAINDAEMFRRQQQSLNPVMNSPAAAPREIPMNPYNQQAALWQQQALRAKLAQIEDLYARTGGIPLRTSFVCANCPRTMLTHRPVAPLRVQRPYFRPRVAPAYVESRANRPFPVPRMDKPFIIPRMDRSFPTLIIDKPFTPVYNPYTSARPVPRMDKPFPMPRMDRPFPAPRMNRPFPVPRMDRPFPVPRMDKPFPVPRMDRPFPVPRMDRPFPVPRMDRPFPVPRMDKPFTPVYNPYTSARPWPRQRNPYNTLTSSGQLPPNVMEAAQAIKMELQQRSGNPYSSVPADPRYTNNYSNIPTQGGMYLPPQATRMPEARTPWDLDPFNQQQNPGSMNDPRIPSKERQLLALAVFKQMMNQQRARMAAGNPVLRTNQPAPPMEAARTTTPEAETKMMPAPLTGNQQAPLGANQQVPLTANQQAPLGANQQVPNEYPQMPTPEEVAHMQQCQPILEPQIKACFSAQGTTMEQFMNPEFIEKSIKVCQNSAQMVQCIQKLEPVCGEAVAQSTKKITDSVLRMLGIVCPQIMSRVPQPAVPVQQTQQQPNNEPQKTAGIAEPQSPTQSPNEVPDDQSMPTLEEQQQMRQCQGVLEPMLNECIRSHGVTIEQFMKPEFMAAARGVCQDSANVAACINKLDSTCGAPNLKTTKKMLNSILGMMGMVCHQIEANGGAQSNKEVAEPVPEPTITQTIQQKPEMVAPTQQKPLDPTDEQQEMPTPEEIRMVQECQPVLEPGLNECLKGYDMNIQQFASPQYMEKARIVCQNSNGVGECVRKLENSCGNPAVIRKMLMSMMRMMTMVCQQIQNRAGENSQPSAIPNQMPTSETKPQAPTAGDANQQGSHPPGMPTQEEIKQIQECQSQLEPKINDCLKSHEVTIQQFHDPQFIEKSRKVCQDGPNVGPCVQQLERACGEDSLLSTRRILKSVLGMMGTVCQQIQAKGPENIPRGHHGPLLRGGHMPHMNENPANENKQPDPAQSGDSNAIVDKQPTGETPSQGVSAKQAGGAGEEAMAKYMSRNLELFGYPLWLIITLILILAVLLLLFVMVVCLCLRRKRKQRKVVITKEACEKPPLPEDDKLCTIGVPPPSYTTTAVQQSEDGLALPPIDIGEDSVSVSMDDSVNEKPPLDDKENKTGKY